MNVQRQYNDYIDKLAHDGVEKYSEEQQQQIDTYESSLKERKQAYIKAADAVSNYTIQSNKGTAPALKSWGQPSVTSQSNTMNFQQRRETAQRATSCNNKSKRQ